MTRFRLLFVFLLAPLFLLAQPGERGGKTTRDTSVTGGNTYAIIVGLSEYKSVRPLQFAHKDAKAFEDFLLSPAGGSVPRGNVETFINEQATRNNVGDAISVIARKAKPGDRVYFYFAGHGDMEDLTQVENGLLLLYNSPNGNYFGMNDDVLEIIDLKRYLSPLAQRGVEMIFIVDACHSGNLKGGIEGSQQTASALASSWGKEYKILSCQPNQLSLESAAWGGGRGLFSLQLEEGMKGLADKNNDKKITFAELQRYITDNVASYSEDKQIPVVSGDLSKPFIKVDSATLANLRKQKAVDYPMMASINTKGGEELYLDSLDTIGKALYSSFRKNLEAKKLIYPVDTNALRDYKLFLKRYNDNPLVTTMRRDLATALNERFNNIVGPLLRDERSFSSRDECYYAAAELDSCLRLLGPQHYMYTNLKARKLFMDAMGLTWALDEAEYNISLRPTVEKSIKLLEESERLEPNAAYTVSALGVRYFFMYEYKKASAKFQKYLDLRPNDFYSKYSLGNIYAKLKQFDKAEALFKELITLKPEIVELYGDLLENYLAAGKLPEALAVVRKVLTFDELSGDFLAGVYFSRTNRLDSAVYYYKHAIEKYNCTVCDNNIGHCYFVNNQLDSARFYFNKALAADSTNPFPIFNLATLDAIDGKFQKAANGFATAVDNSPAFREAFVTHLDLYFNKTYWFRDGPLFDEFSHKTFIFEMQYIAYTSLLYCFMRDSLSLHNPKPFDLIFPQMHAFKDFEVFTWYHHACYRALLNDKTGALKSLEKSLQLGFGTYFLLVSDHDLDSIRHLPAFRALLKKYFPKETGQYPIK